MSNETSCSRIYGVLSLLVCASALACGGGGGAPEDMGTSSPDLSNIVEDMSPFDASVDTDMPADAKDMTTPPSDLGGEDMLSPSMDMPADMRQGQDMSTTCGAANSLEQPIALDGTVMERGCAGEVDWFELALTSGCRAEFDLSPTTQPLSLTIQRANGDLALEGGEASAMPQQARFTLGKDTESIRVGVLAPSGNGEPYTLSSTITCPPSPLTCENGQDDLFEDNNDHSTGNNPATISPGDAFSASMCAAGSNPFERLDYYTIEDHVRYQGCVIASTLNWPVTPRSDGRTNNRNWYRNNENLALEHALGDERGAGGPYQEVLRATWRLGDMSADVEGYLESPATLLIPELDPGRYLDPNLDFDPPRAAWNIQRATAWLYPVDYHVRVSNEAYEQDGSATIPAYDLDVRALCDFSCQPRQEDIFFGITRGDDWFDAYGGLRGGLAPDLALAQGGRLGGFVRGIACPTSPYNGYVDGDQFVTFSRDIDVVNMTSFGSGYVDGVLEGNDVCEATLRIEWSGQNKPQIAFSTAIGDTQEKVWTYDENVSQTNDANNPFYAHSSPTAAFSTKGWLEQPPAGFGWREGTGFIELYAEPSLFNAPSASGVVQAAIAANPSDGADGTPWSARYYCGDRSSQ